MPEWAVLAGVLCSAKLLLPAWTVDFPLLRAHRWDKGLGLPCGCFLHGLVAVVDSVFALKAPALGVPFRLCWLLVANAIALQRGLWVVVEHCSHGMLATPACHAARRSGIPCLVLGLGLPTRECMALPPDGSVLSGLRLGTALRISSVTRRSYRSFVTLLQFGDR